ncbi:MAG TPA: VOC family protein [Gemmatimonadaceae bacterium]|nr:VOC family protein [Gemmatimonadaceae bacterium]
MTAPADRPDSSTTSHTPTPGLYGWITHTDLASRDPGATKEWAAQVFGWKFMPPMPMGDGEYHLFAYAEQGGGGIRATGPAEDPGALPYVHVADAHDAFAKAVEAGAEPVQPPERIMQGVTIAIVRAPGGVTIGIAGP